MNKRKFTAEQLNPVYQLNVLALSLQKLNELLKDDPRNLTFSEYDILTLTVSMIESYNELMKEAKDNAEKTLVLKMFGTTFYYANNVIDAILQSKGINKDERSANAA